MLADSGMQCVSFDSEHFESWQHVESTCDMWKWQSSLCIDLLRHSLTPSWNWKWITDVSWTKIQFKMGMHVQGDIRVISPFQSFLLAHSPFQSFCFVIVFLFLLFIDGASPPNPPFSDNWDSQQHSHSSWWKPASIGKPYKQRHYTEPTWQKMSNCQHNTSDC